MHIPDGYLSPSTCAVLYAGAAPFWYFALQRVKRLFHTQAVPLLSICAAFSFVVMMFNLPLPGGTTGHAVGVGIAAVVLGPWASMLVISVALFIQAVFFGDGGITTFGANSFNMAVVGPLVAYGVYRAIAGRAAMGSARRVVAAALGGYAAINVAALCAAIEFGIQPMLFKDAAGTPLYAPYPLSIAVPAMMLGHLTFAGLAELVISGGVVAYLQRSNPSLLKLTAAGAMCADEGIRENHRMRGWKATRPLWLALAILMILTPLGLLATGLAWGEWRAQDFGNPDARARIAAASENQAAPTRPPRGLERLSSIWTAPMPAYAPPFMRRPRFGYVVSAMVGTGLIVLAMSFIGWIAGRRQNLSGPNLARSLGHRGPSSSGSPPLRD
jgi:cobalt/nickel transport system permease protein